MARGHAGIKTKSNSGKASSAKGSAQVSPSDAPNAHSRIGTGWKINASLLMLVMFALAAPLIECLPSDARVSHSGFFIG